MYNNKWAQLSQWYYWGWSCDNNGNSNAMSTVARHIYLNAVSVQLQCDYAFTTTLVTTNIYKIRHMLIVIKQIITKCKAFALQHDRDSISICTYCRVSQQRQINGHTAVFHTNVTTGPCPLVAFYFIFWQFCCLLLNREIDYHDVWDPKFVKVLFCWIVLYFLSGSKVMGKRLSAFWLPMANVTVILSNTQHVVTGYNSEQLLTVCQKSVTVY